MEDQKLGATGNFPDGKLNPEDEGELRAAVGIGEGHVIVNFGKAIGWLALNPEEAIAFAELLIKKANTIISERAEARE
jgi:hypothetical protein